MEQFPKPKEVKKEDLRVTSEVKHFETAPKSSQEDRKFLEKAIILSDEAAREEHIAVLDRLFNLAGMRATWIDELDDAGKEALQSVVAEYVEAEKRKAGVAELNLIQKKFEKLFD